MGNFFVDIYRFFQKHPWGFRLFLATLIAILVILTAQIRFEEDISRLTSDEQELSLDEYVIRNFNFAEKLIVHLRQTDAGEARPERLIDLAETLKDSLHARCDSTLIRDIMINPVASQMHVALDVMEDNLPLFLDSADYAAMTRMLESEQIDRAMASNYKLLVSPASMILKKRVSHDPLNFSSLILKKLQSLRVDESYILHDGYIFSEDKKHLLFFITPENPPSETQLNGLLVRTLNDLIGSLTMQSAFPVVPVSEKESGETNTPSDLFSWKADYFGSAAVAVGNADQIKEDILLSLSIALLAIFLLIGWYFRNFWIPFIGFIPAFFGGSLALSILFLAKGNISAIALGIGSVILGLIIDYALYMINLYRKKRDVEAVIREMAQTIFVCSLTSIGAFLCLTFLQSAVLHDLGWFAAISVFGAALFALVILPQFLGNWILPGEKRAGSVNFVDRIAAIDFGKKGWLIAGLGIAGIISFFFLRDVSFEEDMNSLNYMSDDLTEAQMALDSISQTNLKNIYIIGTGKTLEAALRKNEQAVEILSGLKQNNVIQDFAGITTLLISDSLQQVRMDLWRNFWSDSKQETVVEEVQQAGQSSGFSPNAFDAFTQLLQKEAVTMQEDQKGLLGASVFKEWVHVKPELTMITLTARVQEVNKPMVYEAFQGKKGIVLFDRQNMTNRFVENVRSDFDTLVTLSMIFVSILLLLSFGRIELGFATALPMFFAWLLTLGFMGLFGIKFNIFNIIISSFVFGLGVDYSILMMRGLLHEYKTGIRDLETYRVSIFLSSTTTIFGVAALFAARHPALNSIALISIIGVVSVVLVSYSYQAMLANWFLFKPLYKHQPPVTFRDMFFSLFVAWIPIATIAFILVLYGILISPLLPLNRRKKQDIFHWIFSRLSAGYIAMNFPRHHAVDNPEDEDFKKPAIIISNHQSLIETPALLRLHPNILILTNNWIYKNWVFGPVAKLAGFPPIADGIEQSLDIIESRIEAGYSILIFPEGTRSRDGRIQRFHRGAFFLAERLQVDILPVVIFGSGDFLPKGNFWGKPSSLYMRILPRITPENKTFGTTYQERAKSIRKCYKKEYARMKAIYNTPDFNRLNLRLNYTFKGPVLEWYVRVKMMLEQNFLRYHELMPKTGRILDLGCGYGYIACMLHLTSPKRQLIGVDYDPDKIQVAMHGYLKDDRIEFIHADITEFPLVPSDGILLGDTLHYLSPDEQLALLHKCMDNLNPGGILLIREGDATLQDRHQKTRQSEYFSTKVMGFNRTRDESKSLWFTSREEISRISSERGFAFSVVDQEKSSSNVFMVIKKTIS